MRCKTPAMGCHSGSGVRLSTETVKRPSAVQDVNFAAKRDAQGCEDVNRVCVCEEGRDTVKAEENECRRVACY